MSGPWVLQAPLAVTGTVAVMPVLPTEPVLAGHYPGYPVLPGVCVVECGHRAALASAPDGRTDPGLAEIDARFLAPVHPGDDLTISPTWTDQSCRVEIRTASTRAATVRLSYGSTPSEPAEPWAAGPGDTLDADEIAALIPHRPPILLLDRADSLIPGKRLTASRVLRADEPWCHDQPYPAVLLIESWCQAAGVLVVHDAPTAGRVMLLGSVQAAIGGPVFPGDRVEHRVRMTKAMGDTSILTGEAIVEGRVVLRMKRIVVAMRQATEVVG